MDLTYGRCAQNSKLSDSSLLIRFNDSTDFDELTEPVSPLHSFQEGAQIYFRKDGHNWRKKKDGETVKEAHEKLKVGSIDVLHCYNAHEEDDENFQRRCYWMLEQFWEPKNVKRGGELMSLAMLLLDSKYFLREVSFFSGPALLGVYPRFWLLRELVLHDKHSSYDPSTNWYCRSQSETDRDNFLNPWEAKEYGLVSTVIDDGKPRLIAEGTNKDLPLE